MKFKVVLFLFIALAPLLAKAQGCITIFSEDGDRFFLVLNGVKQNPAAQANVRVDGLTNDYYNVKVIFEDGTKPEISKNIPVKDAGTGQFGEMTYKIKKNKDGELKIRYYSATPVPVNYTPPADMYSMHYGQPAPATSVSQTTVTTTSGNSGNGSVSFGTPGGGVNINIQDPNGTTTTQTTTTNTYSQSSQGGSVGIQPVNASAGCQYPMERGSFGSAKGTVANASFEDTKLSTAKSILASNCMNTDQVMAICQLFGFEETKLAFAKFAYSKTTDPGNYFKVSNVFSFDASKTDLNNFISNGGR